MNFRLPLCRLACALAAAGLATAAHADLTTFLASPDWDIALSDYGYSDYLGDQTPTFQGREYLSGEWGAAVGYQRSGAAQRTPTWLEPQFIFPDWTTNSDFQVITPMAQGALNGFGLPTAQSVIGNSDLRITQNIQIVDTRTGIAMGNAAASAGGLGASLLSNRYVLMQSYTFENVSGSRIDGLQFFQLLHGYNSQAGVYDNRNYGGAMAEYRHDVTLRGRDDVAATGQFDYIGFHSKLAPVAVELGHYGLNADGSPDDHNVGKPSVGTHLSVEAGALNGNDSFSPANRWVAGAQQFALGSLAAGQSVTFDVALSILTGYQVAGDTSSGSIGGGATSSGGVDYHFTGEHDGGSFFLAFEREDAASVADLIAAGEIGAPSFGTPGGALPLWEIEYDGSFSGTLRLTFGFDPTLLPVGIDAARLRIYHWTGAAWADLGGSFDLARGQITVDTDSLSPFALGLAPVPEPATWALLASGLLVLARRRPRRSV